MPRHHLVPQMYLRNFADGRGQLMMVARDDITRAHRGAVRKACAEVGFYRFPTEALVRPQDRADHDPEIVERLLSLMEERAAPVIRHVVKAGSLHMTLDDRYHLTNFVALQAVRGRRFREDFNAMATQSARLMLHKTVTARVSHFCLRGSWLGGPRWAGRRGLIPVVAVAG